MRNIGKCKNEFARGIPFWETNEFEENFCYLMSCDLKNCKIGVETMAQN